MQNEYDLPTRHLFYIYIGSRNFRKKNTVMRSFTRQNIIFPTPRAMYPTHHSIILLFITLCTVDCTYIGTYCIMF